MLKRALKRFRVAELAATTATLCAAASVLADATQPPKPPPVPEPSAALIFAVGAAGVVWAVRRRRS